MPSQTWKGKSGSEYEFDVHPVETNWTTNPGIYIFARDNGNTWTPIYIGQTGNFKQRLVPSHEKWDCATRNGMTHIHILYEFGGEDARKAIEKDLKDNYRELC